MTTQAHAGRARLAFWLVLVAVVAGLLNPVLGVATAASAAFWARGRGRLPLILWALAAVWLVATTFVLPQGGSGAGSGS